MEEILNADAINRWAFFPLDFTVGAENEPLLDIGRTFPFELKDNRRQESANLSRLMVPFPASVHALGETKAQAKRERYKADGKDKAYEYRGYLETVALSITSITVSSVTLALAHEPDDDILAPNPAHVSIEMLGSEGIPNAKAARIAVRDKLARAFGTVLVSP